MADVDVSDLHGHSDLHVARKVFHAINGIIMLSCHYLFGHKLFTKGLLLISIVFTIADFSRSYLPFAQKIARKLIGFLMRKEEAKQMTGSTFYMIGCAIVFLFFPPLIAKVATVHLAFGDPIASFFGILFGDRMPRLSNGKSLIGTAAAWMVNMAATACLLAGVQPLAGGAFAAAVIITSLFGALAEACPLPVNDNLVIPLVSAATTQVVLTMALGGPHWMSYAF
eukprot:gnl/Trimastix_PCT/4026.p1 GENE.gnl/Trimastix_PCT/4026~~gnl/Trimastix_PCT/4026.p1  ORF type:complete len:225 (-),score=38.79 gnl/Trimastix_PCT/4026:46-720(-)